ncbi:MAG: hypothetical protein ABSF43_16930 [Rectinemataceae bacterium]
MKRTRILIACLLTATLFAAPLAAAAPTVSEKKDVAIFALGYYGWAIPLETLGSIDMEIQKVFVDLGRFNIIGYSERLSSGGLQQFIATLKKAKEANFVMPEKFQFGEATLTEAEFNKLVGAFIIATPIVSEFNSRYNSDKSQWETDIKTNVTFIDVGAGGSILGIAEVKSSGSDKTNQNKSISNAIEGIPLLLQFEIRKIEAFQINTRVLAASGSEIKLQLGQNMGIKKGDEYSIIVSETIEGFKNESEKGLVQIKEVGSEVSTGRVVYSSIKLSKDVQLHEIPRLGIDAEGYFHMAGGTAIPGLKFTLSRGFYGFRPYGAVQIPVSEVSTYFGLLSVIPVNAIVGGEYNLYLGRFTLTPYGGVGASYAHVLTPVNSSDQTDWLSHIGGQAYLRASILFTRELSVFAEGGFEYWASMNSFFFNNYGGLSFGGGVTYKL